MPYRDPADPLYRPDRFLYLWCGPVAIAVFGFLGASSDTGTFVASADLVGRVMMALVVLGAAFARWRTVRLALFFVMSGAFLGRAAALVSVGSAALDEVGEVRSAIWYVAVWIVSVGMLLQTEIIRTWDEEHRG